MTDEPTPILGALRGPGRLGRAHKARWLAFLFAMLAFHAYPVSDLVHRGWSLPAMIATLIPEAIFAALWIRTNWLAMGTNAPFRAIAPWLYPTVALGTAMALILGANFKGLLIYVSIACAVSLPVRWVLPALFGATALGLVAEYRNPQYLGLGPGSRLNEIVTGLSLIFFLGLMMASYRRAMMLITELRQAREDLARLAVTEERLRFARDLHDLLGHSLTTIALKSQVARRLADRDSRVALEVADIESVAQQALAEVREAVTGYRGRTFAEELDAARATLAAAGIEVTVRLERTPLPPQLDALLGWVVREGTTNVLRHSRARTCAFRLSRNATTVTLDVADDGVGAGAGPAAPGNGLAGLAERVTGAGGELDCGPGPDRGFRLAARLPLVGAVAG